MASDIFNRETMLDLLVNVIPLFILGFFIVAFLVSSPFGIDPLASSIQFGLIAVPLVLLAVLTYFAGRAVAGSENSGPIYLPGQASVRGAEPLEVPGDGSDAELDAAGTAASELDGDHAASEGSDPEADADTDDEPDGTEDDDSDPDGTEDDDSDSGSDTPDDDAARAP